MKIVFLFLLLVSVVYSSGSANPKCGTIQHEKCNAFSRIAGRACFCNNFINAQGTQTRYCTVYADKACAKTPSGSSCKKVATCPKDSPVSLACDDFCKKEGARCNSFYKTCGALKTINA